MKYAAVAAGGPEKAGQRKEHCVQQQNAGRISPPGKHYGLYIAFPQHTDKLEFDAPSERVIPNQSADWCGNLLVRRTTSRGRVPENGTKRAVCMTIDSPKFDGDSHTSVSTGSE
ncbi:MAG: hypothetical protein MSS94_08375 [Clostridiales bacterium]|nr:hypothetical protein [Clostridiales bacterium]